MRKRRAEFDKLDKEKASVRKRLKKLEERGRPPGRQD